MMQTKTVLRAAAVGALLLCAGEAPARAFQAVPAWWNTAWTRREPISIQVGATAPQGGYNGYTARFALDTAALVTGGLMLAGGNDLRVVRWDGAAWTDLSRHVLSMNTATTDVRFMLVADIAASTTDTSYYLYYGNPAAGGPPAMTTTNVYLWYDDTTVDRVASYTNGRIHASGPGPGVLTSPSSIVFNAGGYYTYDTTNDHNESLRRTGLSERDVLATYDLYQTGAYDQNMCSGPIVRLTTDGGAPAAENASGFYFYLLGNSNSTVPAALTPYAGHGDICQTLFNTGAAAPITVDGTAPQVTINGWHSVGLAAWGAGGTNLKGWYVDAPGATSLGLFGATATVSGTQATGDTTAAGQAGLNVCQDIGRLRNILIRRYTEPEPASSRGAAQTVPAAGGGGGGGGGAAASGGGSGDDGKCGCGVAREVAFPAVFLAAVLALLLVAGLRK